MLGYQGGCSLLLRALNIHKNAGGFVIAAGAILGICAGLLWSAQVGVRTSSTVLYPIFPPEGQLDVGISDRLATSHISGTIY